MQQEVDDTPLVLELKLAASCFIPAQDLYLDIAGLIVGGVGRLRDAEVRIFYNSLSRDICLSFF